MDRGTDALKSNVSDVQTMTFRQTLRYCVDPFDICCYLGRCCKHTKAAPPAEFQVFVGDNQVAKASEDVNRSWRLWCAPIHPFSTVVMERSSEDEMITIDRPFRCPFCCCKCCSFQEATVTSGGQELGSMKEDCFFCVPTFEVHAPDGSLIYKVRPPTCCCGNCVDCCCMDEYPDCCEAFVCCCKAKEEPCFACCRIPFHVFPASQEETTDGARHIGKIFKPFENRTGRRADIFAVQIDFPIGATPQEKGLLMGSALFLNANFFEESVNDWEDEYCCAGGGGE